MIGSTSFYRFVSGIVSGAPLVPQRSVIDAVRIALDGSRGHTVAEAVRIPLAAWTQGFANLQSRLHEPTARLFAQPRVVETTANMDLLGLNRFAQEKGLGGVDRYFRSHPLVEEFLLKWKSGRPQDALEAVSKKRLEMKPYLIPAFLKCLEAIETQAVAEEVRTVREGISVLPAVNEGGRRLDPSFFVGLNSRGIGGYNRQLFGFDPLGSRGFHLQPEEIEIERLIHSLPQGAVVADWGAGAGVFGVELKEVRPDLTIYLVDQYAPEEVLPIVMPGEGGQSLLEDVRTSTRRIVGDALGVTLPEGVEADCLFSVALSPYIPDPVGLLAHMYNQLAPGGLMIATVTQFIHDVSLPWHQIQDVILPLVSDLRRQGVKASFFRGHKVLALQRPDRRRMKRTAALVGSFYEPFEMNLGTRRIELEHCLSFYRPSGALRRWVELV